MHCAYPAHGYRTGQDTEYHGDELAVGFFSLGSGSEGRPERKTRASRMITVPAQEFLQQCAVTYAALMSPNKDETRQLAGVTNKILRFSSRVF